MQHRFTHPVRVQEIRPREPEHEEPETDDEEVLPPAPAADDDGAPDATLPRMRTVPR